MHMILPIKSVPPAADKISTGILPLDEMLYGGILRGSTTMITGIPGTAKTTLAGAFCEATAKRGERTVYVAFDETGEEIVRNLSSVNIQLREHVHNGILRMHSEDVASGYAEEHFHRIKTYVQRQQATCLVIDPFTAFSSGGNSVVHQAVAARLVGWVKSEGITLVCTSLPMWGESGFSGAVSEIAAVVDTWLYLSFFNNGERSRGLTILKPRVGNHSNQLRELVLSSSGISIVRPGDPPGA